MADLLLEVETSVFIAELVLCLFRLIYPLAHFFSDVLLNLMLKERNFQCSVAKFSVV